MSKIKCKVCGNEFAPNVDSHYVSRDKAVTGFKAISGSEEVTLYDTFDCPYCGCQAVVGERKRGYNQGSRRDKEDGKE